MFFPSKNHFKCHLAFISDFFTPYCSLMKTVRVRHRPSTWQAVSSSSPPSPHILPIYAEAMASAYINSGSRNSTSFRNRRTRVDPRVECYFDLEAVLDNTEAVLDNTNSSG